MDFLIENFVIIIAGIALGFMLGSFIARFLDKPGKDQMNQVKEWLLYAVIKAEKELGSGTGQVKLRYVYDMFVIRFPWLVRIIPFESFSSLVDEALDNMKDALDGDEAVQHYVEEGREE